MKGRRMRTTQRLPDGLPARRGLREARPEKKAGGSGRVQAPEARRFPSLTVGGLAGGA